MTHQRRERVAESLRAELSRLLLTGMHDPRIGFVTVTGVSLSPDLRHARVHVSVLADAARQEECMRALEGARGWLRRELARTLSLRRVPDLVFRLDTTEERSERIEHLLREVIPPREPESGEDEDTDT